MFVFKNVSSDIMAVRCVEENFIGRPQRNYSEYSIDGRDGIDYDVLGYQNFTSPLEIIVFDIYKVDDVLSWLDGKGEFEYQDRKTTAYFLDTIPIQNIHDKVVKIKTNFIRSPFWYSITEQRTKVTDSITNNGNIYSKPIIEMHGANADNVKLTVNDITLEYTFDEDERVVIDCFEMTESFNGKSKSKLLKIGYEYPILHPGINKISIEGNADVFFSRKDTWL